MKKMMAVSNQIAKVAVCDGKNTAVFQHTEISEVPCIEIVPAAKLLEGRSVPIHMIGYTPIKRITYKKKEA